MYEYFFFSRNAAVVKLPSIVHKHSFSYVYTYHDMQRYWDELQANMSINWLGKTPLMQKFAI